MKGKNLKKFMAIGIAGTMCVSMAVPAAAAKGGKKGNQANVFSAGEEVNLFSSEEVPADTQTGNANHSDTVFDSQNELKHTGYAAEGEGENFDRIDKELHWTMGQVDLNDPDSDYSFWHFVDSSKTSKSIVIYFIDENGIRREFTFDAYASDKGQHYQVITPSGWYLDGGYSNAGAVGEFNLSHSGMHKAERIDVTVDAILKPYHYEITPQEYYERNVKNFYARNVKNYYERDTFETYRREQKDVYKPVFEKRTAQDNESTLVTRLNGDGDRFQNGHTYVQVNVAEVEAAGDVGKLYTIAHSNPQNTAIGCSYKVVIKDGMITVSVPDAVGYASIGAEAVTEPSQFINHTPKHDGASNDKGDGDADGLVNGAFSTKLPPVAADGTIWLYTHIQNGLTWYVKDNGEYVYEFVKWELDEELSAVSDYLPTGEYTYGEYELVKTTPLTEYKVANTVPLSEYVQVTPKEGQPSEIYSDKIWDTYAGNAVLTVDGVPTELGTVKLTPGTHTFVLEDSVYGVRFEQTAAISADNHVVLFEEEFETTPDIKSAEKHYTDIETETDYKDIETEKSETNRMPAIPVKNDTITKLPDEYLGDAEHPNAEINRPYWPV